MVSTFKSIIYTIVILVAMVFFIDNYGWANAISVNLWQQDTIKQHNKLIFETFIDSNSRFSYQHLSGLFIRKGKQTGEIIEEHKSTERFDSYVNKEIVEIKYLRLKAFGQSVYNLNKIPEEWPEKLGNTFHTTTLRNIVAHNVLFKVNDKLQPIDLVETEQIIRERSYIEDVNIVVEPTLDSNKVRVVVITKDKFTMGAHLDFRNFDRWQSGISESSLGGLGITFKGDVYHNSEREAPYGYKFEIKSDNIFGSFISTNAYYRKGVGYDTKYLNINRDFYASKVHLAGGFMYMDSRELYGVHIIDSTISINYELKDCWLGYSFRLTSRNAMKAPYLLTIATKYRHIEYFDGLPTTVNLNPYFNSTKHYLLSLGVARQNLYQSNLIYQFGSTEDIPIGFRVQFATGFEEDKFQRRYLVNGEITGANYFRIGYLYASMQLGGYATENKTLEQASFNIKSTYISNLMNIGRHDIRQFFSVNYTKGLNRFNGEKEYIILQNNYGVRGLRSPNLVGTTRMVVNLETMAYSPFKIYGFRLAYFLFCDLGLIGFKDDYFDNFYSGVGFGLRLRNESTVFPTVIFRLAYYPVVPQNASFSNYYMTSESRRRFEQFRAREPRILPFE